MKNVQLQMALMHELFGAINARNGIKSINFAEIEAQEKEQAKKLALHQKKKLEK